MDIISSLNSAFTQVQRFENMSFGTDGNSTQVGYTERESTSNLGGATGLPGGRGGLAGFLPDSSTSTLGSAVHNAVAYDRAEGGSLQLRTQEGDVVRLKFLNSESANAQNQQFENGASTVTDFSMTGSNSSQFKIVVEGDLNGAEINAIRDVLIQAREMANTFFDGEVKEAFGMASSFNIESEQLANVNMNFNVSETYTYAQTTVEQQVVQDPVSHPTMPITPAVDSAPPAVPTVATTPDASLVATLSQPNVTATAPTAGQPEVNNVTQVAPVQPEPEQTQVHTAPDPVDSPLNVAANPAQNLANALSTITSFLSQLTESLNAQFQGPGQGQPDGSSHAFSVSSGFQLQVVSSMIGQLETNAEGEKSDAGNLAVKTMDELAMKMDAFVDAMI